MVLCLLIVVTAQGAERAPQLSTDSAQAAIRQYVLRNGPWAPENVEVRVVPFPAVALPAGKAAYRILKPTKGVTPGPISFLLAADVDGKERARVWVKTEIRIFEEVLVSSAPLARHESIDAADVRLARRDITALTGKPFKSVDEITGQQAAHAIEINEILTQKSLDRPSLMRRGSPVTLLYETRTMRVESPGMAVDGGKLGDVIAVKNATSGKLLRGVVLDERTVRIN